ncbi:MULTISPECIES: TlpA family protein disulfide reductase [Falsihalocynthiibacter]|uniref:TlpA family protein disulfide reductase n=1 Tax=Falsihalocynthiibacter TaxID=2854182 RepID=UPI0030032BEE
MRNLWLAPLYAGLALSANAAFADLADLRVGSLEKLQIHSAPVAGAEAIFFDPEGNERTLSDYDGKITLVNFWATWCAPCRKEMPSLDRLAAQMESEDFAVVTVATGRNKMAAIEKFFATENIQNLPILLDPKSALAREMNVEGLPATILLDRQGQEVARLVGEAEWDSESAKAIFAELIAQK